jgi:hypothetical protein
MPIIYVCSDGKNEKLQDFLKEHNVIDSLYFSNDQETAEFVEELSETICCTSLLMMINLNDDPNEDYKKILTRISSKKNGNFMIVCKKNIMKLIHSQYNYDEWDSDLIN